MKEFTADYAHCQKYSVARRRVEVPWSSFDKKVNLINSNYWKTTVIIYNIYYIVLLWANWLTLNFLEKKLAARKLASQFEVEGRRVNT